MGAGGHGKPDVGARPLNQWARAHVAGFATQPHAPWNTYARAHDTSTGPVEVLHVYLRPKKSVRTCSGRGPSTVHPSRPLHASALDRSSVSWVGCELRHPSYVAYSES